MFQNYCSFLGNRGHRI